MCAMGSSAVGKLVQEVPHHERRLNLFEGRLHERPGCDTNGVCRVCAMNVSDKALLGDMMLPTLISIILPVDVLEYMRMG
jgi:hypothetical protein